MGAARSVGLCAIVDCLEGRWRRGWCSEHWWNWHDSGDPTVSIVESVRLAAFESGLNFSMYCWTRRGSTNPNAYTQFSHRGFRDGAHRFAFQVYVGPIPDGFVVDHRCRNKSCVNPMHLRLATRTQNAQNQPTRAKSGHRNVYPNSGGWSVKVGLNHKVHLGGWYRDLDEAAEAARLLRNELFTHNDEDRRS